MTETPCVQCGGPRRLLAVQDADPYCSVRCAKAAHDVRDPLTSFQLVPRTPRQRAWQLAWRQQRYAMVEQRRRRQTG